jgi:predicted ATPase
LALAVAKHLQHYFSGGAVFVSLAEIHDPALMASTIGASLGVSDASTKPPQTKLIEFLRRKSILLVLDNCEQISEAAPRVAELLAACAGVVILATSRERLHLRAEQRHRVLPLALESAVELFSLRAAAVDSTFELTTANRPSVEAICQLLDRLPLALELCAAQTDLLSLPQLLAHLQEHRLDLLVDGAHDLPPRQRTLRHAIQCSYALLIEEESALFRSLGIFTGGFALPELEAVSAWNQDGGTSNGMFIGGFENLPALHALIGKSLVQVQTMPSGEQRFVLLEMIREFAVEQLRAYGEEGRLRERHFATYLQLFRGADNQLRGVDAATCLARLRPEQDNLRAETAALSPDASHRPAPGDIAHFLWRCDGRGRVPAG